MSCEFDSLYFAEDGYIVRCKDCGHFQIAFLSTMLTLTAPDFQHLRKLVNNKLESIDETYSGRAKSIALPTPSQGIWLLLTSLELKRFYAALEEADSEATSLSLLDLFNTK